MPEDAPEQEETRRELGRELWALLLVYSALIVLPLLTGFACQGPL